jgi:hypothetical protein
MNPLKNDASLNNIWMLCPNSHNTTAWGGVVVNLGTSRKDPGSIPGGVTGDFFGGIRQFHVPGVDSAS